MNSSEIGNSAYCLSFLQKKGHDLGFEVGMFFYKQILISCLVFGFLGSANGAAEIEAPRLPTAEARRQMVLKLKSEIDRVDGEGLIPRFNRPENWGATVDRLAKEAFDAKNLYELGLVFKRLDATYPNLHAKVHLIPALDERKISGKVVLPFKFSLEVIAPAKSNRTYRIKLDRNFATIENGDQLVSINSIPIEKWADENFIFCKFPLREQCEVEFFDNFRNELLGWNRHQELRIEVKRHGKLLSENVSPEFNTSNESEDGLELPCDVNPKRYKSFKVAYEGQNLCAFESKKHPGTVVLRIINPAESNLI